MMQRNTLLFISVSLLLTGRINSSDEECGLVSDDLMNESNVSQIQCNSNNGAFLRSVPFTVGLDMSVQLDIDAARCFYPACCNRFFRRPLGGVVSYKGDSRIDFEGVTRVGDSIGPFSCRGEGLAIRGSTARCDSLEADGSGWGYLRKNEANSLCQPCPAGSFFEDGKCKLCPKGKYNDEEGATECKPCPRGRYTKKEGASRCLYCPAGHTTYKYSPNTCVGPQLNIYADKSGKNLAFTARVSYDTLGNLKSTDYWSSEGDWELLNGDNRPFSTIRERFTSSYRQGPRVILKRLVKAVQPIVKNVYCYSERTLYRGYVERTVSGKKCTGPRQHCTRTNRGTVCYCGNRRANHGDAKPYCETITGAEENCDIPKCADQPQGSSGNERPPLCSYEIHDRVSESSFDSAPTEFDDLDIAKRICDKQGGECTGVWGEGSSWRVTGIALSEVEMGSGTQTFIVKSPDCVNPYYEYYFEQTWGT